VDGELDFVWGEAEGQPGRVSHRERLVKLCRKCVEVGCEGSSRGGRVRDEKSDRASLVDLGSDCEGEGAVRILKDTSSDIWEGGCDQGGLFMFRGGGSRSVKSSFCCGKQLGGRDIGHRVAGGCDLCGSEGLIF